MPFAPTKTGVVVPREPAVDLVRIISEGTYTSFPQALKEFVSNSYDADATRVEISLDEDCSAITIRDNGVGMTLREFGESFASIARSGRAGARTIGGRTRLGRPKIGRFGIGALAIVGTAERFTIRSVARNTREGFEAKIDLKDLRRHFHKGEDLSKYWRFEYQLWDTEAASTQFTEIRIEGIRTDLREMLRRPGIRTSAEFFQTTKQLSGLEELAWQLGVICPVAYSGGYPVDPGHLDIRRDKTIIARSRRLLRDNFSVFLNGRPVRRQIMLPRYDPANLTDQTESALLSRRGLGFDIQTVRSPRGAPTRFEGYVVVQAMQLFPLELRGLLIRLRGVAVGWHWTLNLGAYGLSTMLPTMSGEIWVDGLEDALQFDRESFREDHPQFVNFRKKLSEIIRAEATKFRNRSAARKRELKRLRPRGVAKKRGPTAPSPPPPLQAATKAAQPVIHPPAIAPPPQPSPEAFLNPEIFESQPEYIKILLPQINGCWERGYYEATAMVARRLIETLIIELYFKRGWIQDVKEPKTGDFFTLRGLINKVCGDQRVGLEGRAQTGLRDLKKLGDIATHDFKIRIRRPDLEKARAELRYTCERLIFKITGTGP